MTEVALDNADSKKMGNAKLIYILYLVGVVFPITAIIGLVMAYVNRTNTDDPVNSHYQFQIRTFWIGFLFLFIGGLTSIVLVGYLILLFWLIWAIVRCVKGISLLSDEKTHPNPKSWMFG